MNNEPVAWMYNYENFPDSFVVCRARKSDQDIPLYTQPTKTITDEKITEIYKKVYEEGHENQVIALARAILKKAQK